MIITCSKCHQEKPSTDFWKDAHKKSTGRCSSCKDCVRLHRGRRIVPAHKRKRATINGLPPDGVTLADKRRFIDSSKLGKPCCACGTFHHHKAMDYHHLDEATKSFSLSSIRAKKTHDITLEMITDEINKCILLCATCHRKLHYNALCLLTTQNESRLL